MISEIGTNRYFALGCLGIFFLFFWMPHASFSQMSGPTLTLTDKEYEDRAHAVWIAQMAGTIMGMRFEHRTASVEWVDHLPDNITAVFVDDDWYYEMAAIRAFEKYGINLTVQQLGQQWNEN